MSKNKTLETWKKRSSSIFKASETTNSQHFKNSWWKFNRYMKALLSTISVKGKRKIHGDFTEKNNFTFKFRAQSFLFLHDSHSTIFFVSWRQKAEELRTINETFQFAKDSNQLKLKLCILDTFESFQLCYVKHG